MRQFIALISALFASALAPALAFAVPLFLLSTILQSPSPPILAMLFFSFFIALAHSLTLGLIGAAVLLRIGKFRVIPMLIAGLVVGIIPAAFFGFPDHATGSVFWSGGQLKIDDGVPTLAGWIDYLQLLAKAGVFGAIGSTAFYLVFRRILPAYPTKSTPSHEER